MLNATNERGSILIESCLFLTGTILFAYYTHYTTLYFLLSLLGLLIIVVLIGLKIRNLKDIQYVFDIYLQTKNFTYYIILGLLLGFVFGGICRDFFYIQIFPGKLSAIAFTAALTGSTEELLFRGYLQKLIRPAGVVLSVLTAALFHTIYKFIFFLSRQSYVEIDYLFLVQWTFFVRLINMRGN